MVTRVAMGNVSVLINCAMGSMIVLTKKTKIPTYVKYGFILLKLNIYILIIIPMEVNSCIILLDGILPYERFLITGYLYFKPTNSLVYVI